MELSWAYGVPPSAEAATTLLHRALDLGCDHLDTARIYGAGHNEALLGTALAGRRDEFFLASKAGLVADGELRRIDCRPATLRAEIEHSLRQLRTDRIDLYYLHRLDPTTPIEDSVGALAELVRAGKIGAIGLSEMSAETLRRAARVHPIAAMQSEYSLWTRNVEIALLEACLELDTTLVAFSPLGRGALANGLRDPATLASGDLRRTHPRFNAINWPRNLSLIDQYNAIAAAQGLTPAQLALAWVLSRGNHVVAIPGTTNLMHLAENLATPDAPLAPRVLDQLDALINQHTVAGRRYPDAIQRTVETEEFP
ncbi:MAG: aldo/keto reductase [Gammaproteobacteria bacterium]|nr:aldo/keto reductase [Gammaproteobacteria bacterium]